MNSTRSLTIPYGALLASYGFTFLCLALVLIDRFTLHGAIQGVLPRTPDTLFWYALVFVNPHVIASLFSFADGEYLSFYRRKLLYEVPVFLAAALAVYYLAPSLSFLVFILYTEYHQMSQQGGIGRFYFKARLPEYEAWRWLSIVIFTIGYGQIFPDAELLGALAKGLGLWSELLYLPFFVLTYLMYRRIKNSEGRAYLLALAASLFADFLMLFLGYPLFALLCPRVIHDVPAFIAYAVHDHNRAREARPSLVYRLLSFTRLPAYVVGPVLAIGIAYALARIPLIAAPLLFLIGMAHYYIEGFIWKTGSLHRKYLAFG